MSNTTHCVERYINSQYLISFIELLKNRSIQPYEWISRRNRQQARGRHCTMEMDQQLNLPLNSFRRIFNEQLDFLFFIESKPPFCNFSKLNQNLALYLLLKNIKRERKSFHLFSRTQVFIPFINIRFSNVEIPFSN